MSESFREALSKSLSVQLADLALQIPSLRRWALAKGNELLYDFYCVKRFEGLPLGVQEFRHQAVMNLLRAMERGVADGRVSRRARLGILRVLVGNMIVNARKNVAPFISEHGYEPPAFLVVSPTQRCNLYCKGCYASASSKTTATLSYDVFRRIIRDKREHWGSCFTVISGGEPLMYRSDGRTIFDIFEEFQDDYFLMYTNGTMMSEAVAERLAKLGNVTPAISVEGFENETDVRRGKGVFHLVERAMDAMRRAGVPFGISMTATRENAETLLSEEIIRHYFEEKGAIYAWMFHYMPMGRSYMIDLMVTPEQRRRMLDRQLELARNRGLFFIDFWNGGPMSAGCIGAGRSGGYFHIDWNGDISPCVFIPYAVDNVHSLYRGGKSLTAVLDNPAFRAMRDWQREYAGRNGTPRTRNLFMPCPIRDHHQVGHDIVVRFGAKPLHPDAAAALEDPQYHERMNDYGRQLSTLLDPVWESEVESKEPPSA